MDKTKSKTHAAYAVITGASSGIGWEAAKAFAACGLNLVLAARRSERLEQLRSEILASHTSLDIIIKCVDLSVHENALTFYKGVRNLPISLWLNSAGFGNYASVAEQDIEKIERMLKLNVDALTTLSTLFVRDFKDVPGALLINVSSAGGYTIVPTAITYCATKFYVSAFTEGLARELELSGAKMRAKVLAPAATKTEFGNIANDTNDYDYDKRFSRYHTATQMAHLLIELCDSEKTVGIVDRDTLECRLCDGLFEHAFNSAHNQKTKD